MDKFGDSPSFFISLLLNKEFLAKVKHPEELKTSPRGSHNAHNDEWIFLRHERNK